MNAIDKLKLVIGGLILVQAALIALGVWLILQGQIITGIFVVIANTVCMMINIHSLLN